MKVVEPTDMVFWGGRYDTNNSSALFVHFGSIFTDTIYCKKYWHPLLMKGLTTLVISMSVNLNV